MSDGFLVQREVGARENGEVGRPPRDPQEDELLLLSLALTLPGCCCSSPLHSDSTRLRQNNSTTCPSEHFNKMPLTDENIYAVKCEYKCRFILGAVCVGIENECEEREEEEEVERDQQQTIWKGAKDIQNHNMGKAVWTAR
jgi:hypothetical protein